MVNILQRDSYPIRPALKSVDVYQEGTLSSFLRDYQIAQYDAKYGPIESFIIVPSKYMLTKCEFIAAAFASFREIECIEYDDPDRAKAVLGHIYDAFAEYGHNTDALFQFTATAMHNMYGFNNFIKHEDKTSLEISRGLLQTTGPTGYANLKKCGLSYAYLSLLDEYNAKSIKIEVKTFMNFYYQKICDNSQREAICTRLESFFATLFKLAPNEAVDLQKVCEDRRIFDKQFFLTTEDKCKLIRRLRYYVNLQYYTDCRLKADLCEVECASLIKS